MNKLYKICLLIIVFIPILTNAQDVATKIDQQLNEYDAEVLAADGQIELAIKNYEQSLVLDPTNEHAKEQLKLLKK
jgi:flavodoxin